MNMKFFQQKKGKETEIDFERQRREKLTEIGLCLREFREHNNLSVDVVSNQTHIPMRLIKALENGDFEELPEPIYTRELLRKYANYLGLKGDDFAEHFQIQRVAKKKIKHYQPVFNFDISRLKLNPFSLYVIYIVLMFFSVKNLASFVKTSPFNSSNLSNIEIIKDQGNVDNKITPKNSSPEIIPVVESKKKPSIQQQKLTINITVKEQCWVRLIIDDEKEIEKVFNKGEKHELTAKQKLTIRAGNAGGLLVGVNEEKPKTLGKLGEVEEVTFELPRSS